METRLAPSRPYDGPTLADHQPIAPVARAPHQHALWRRETSGRQVRFVLQEERTTIGRGEDVDLMLPSTSVSRHHAVVIRRPGEFHISDLNSLHGILLNGVRVHSADLRDGDIIQLADILLVYEQA